MKVNILPLSAYSTSSIKYNNSKVKYANRNGMCDAFVKSSKTSQPSFTSSIADKYPRLKSIMTSYVMNSEELSNQEIENIINLYCPNVTVDDMKNLPKNTNATVATSAYTYMPVAFEINMQGKLTAKAQPMKMYIKHTAPNITDKKLRAYILCNILHESTHIMQESSDDRKSLLDFQNEFLKNQKNMSYALASIKALNPVFSNTEKSMQYFLANSFNIGSLPKEIKRSIDIDSIFMKKAKVSASRSASNILVQAIEGLRAQLGNFDTNFILDYVILKANNEKEAYQNGLESLKENLGLTSKTDFDVLIEMYDAIIKAANNLKESGQI